MYAPDLDALLARFAALASPHPAYANSHHHVGGEHDRHVVIGVMTHGDEVGPLPAAVAFIEELQSGGRSFGGRLTLVIGNPEAGRADRRFLEADLNRVFLESVEPTTHEHRRARELMPILASADLFIDLHQTIEASEQPFYIGPWNPGSDQWSRALAAAEVWVTRPPGQSFSSGTCCADEYARNQGHTAITIELGQKGFDEETTDRALEIIDRALHIMDAIESDCCSLAEAADGQPELEYFVDAHLESFASASLALRPGLVNFQPVSRGEQLSAPERPHLEAPVDGVLLFPKYPPREADGSYRLPLPHEIYRLLAPLEGDPYELWNA